MGMTKNQLAILRSLAARGDTEAQGALAALEPGIKILTYAASLALDFSGLTLQDLTLTGNIIFTSRNLAAGRSLSIRLRGGASPRTLTFPAGWKFLGAAAPATLTASKTGMLSLESFGTTDANVVAGYSEEA